ncbi:olfactory receptor 14A16-like [Dromaius novaehollandiae]|uniref:olfactory receptor 14A16-like n=1 Tax=Dromaius novaehollandiae TaxID=8790 RepID=UPI0031201EBC
MPGESKMSNSSSLHEFFLLAFADTRELQLLHFSLFLGIYLAALLAEFYLLTAMAYDRFIAICRPLHYGTLMDSRACVQMAAAAWGSGFLHAVLHTANTFSIPLCQGNALDQFFCENPQILKLSCSDSYLRELGFLVVGACLVFGCFIFIVVSYVQIFTAVLRIPSEQGQHKAFSMCLPHLAVVSLFLSTVMFAYLKPPSLSSPSLDLVVAVLYSVVPPEQELHYLVATAGKVDTDYPIPAPQFGYKDVMEDHVKDLPKFKVYSMHCTPLVHTASRPTTEGSQIGQAQFALDDFRLAVPKAFVWLE